MLERDENARGGAPTGWEFVTNPWTFYDPQNWRATKVGGTTTYVHGHYTDSGQWVPGDAPGFKGGSGAGQGTSGGGGAEGGGYGSAHTIPETLEPIPQGTSTAGLGITPADVGLTGAGVGGAAAGAGGGSITIDPTTAAPAGTTASGWSKFMTKVGGTKGLLQLLAKGWTLYELYNAVTGDAPKPQTGGGGGGKGGKGGGGGGKYPLPSGPPQYQGLNYKPSFLAWQPENAGAPVFTSGGPSSLYGSPAPTPPPVTKKKKKG